MNAKTTLLLAIALMALGIVYYVPSSTSSRDAQVDEMAIGAGGASQASRELIEETLGEIAKIEMTTKSGEAFVFEADAEVPAHGQPTWRMVSPMAMNVNSYEVQRIGTQLGDLDYEISYAAGEPGAVSAVHAGLDPPHARVALTDKDGTSVAIEIGGRASASETYVRLAGEDRIFVAKANLKDIVKPKALDYRDLQLWRYDGGDTTRVTITDRSDRDNPVEYTLADHDGDWMFEVPFSAKATPKVKDMLRAMSMLRAAKWCDQGEDRMAMYGLDTPVLTIRATVETQVEVEAGEGDEAAADEEEASDQGKQTRTETKTYVVHVSDRSPLDDETKVYVRPDGEPFVGMIAKYNVDKLRPAIKEWRDSQVTSVETQSATRIELHSADASDGPVALIRQAGRWVFESGEGAEGDSADGELAGGDSAAETADVNKLLQAIANLKAVVFVESDGDVSPYGLDHPRMEIRLTIPGVEDVERIAVGSYTDEKTKRMVYVRRNEVSSIAKVRVADVEALLRKPNAYRDRTVMDLPTDSITQLDLSLGNPHGSERMELSLVRGDGGWSLSAPVEAEAKTAKVQALAQTLARLRAESIVAGEVELTAYGLHNPSAGVVVTYNPPEELRIDTIAGDKDKSQDGQAGDPKKVEPVKVQPPPKTILLSFSDHDGRVYAKRSDRSAIYEIARPQYERFFTEYHADKVWAFDESAVQEFSIRDGDQTHVFKRSADGWIYPSEPDLPLDGKKVDDLLLQIQDLRTKRFTSYAEGAGASVGLAEPAREVQVTLADDVRYSLAVSETANREDAEAGYYATVVGQPGIFLLPAETIARFSVNLDELESP